LFDRWNNDFLALGYENELIEKCHLSCLKWSTTFAMSSSLQKHAMWIFGTLFATILQ